MFCVYLNRVFTVPLRLPDADIVFYPHFLDERGGTRRFMLRHRSEKGLKHQLELTSGSFLLMQGTTQHSWQHQIPKTKRPVPPRINLTF